MVYTLYSVLDVHVGFGMPVVQDNDPVAMRNFENVCCDSSSVYSTHSSDFSLWAIGTFDSSTGELESIPQRKVCNAYDFVNHLREE